MKIEKTKGKKYQIRKMIKGKTYYLFFDTKPTKNEIKKALMQKLSGGTTASHNSTTASGRSTDSLSGGTDTSNITMGELIQEYINDKKNELSPSTIRGYTKILKNLKNDIKKTYPQDINKRTIQQLINTLANENKSRKTIKNIIGLITATLSYNDYNINYRLLYPQDIKEIPYIPTDQDIQLLNNNFFGTHYYTFFRLCLYGLRCSEILALTIKDINQDTNEITINKAMVQNENNEYIVKTTKTIASNRIIKVDKQLVAHIITQQKPILCSYQDFKVKLYSLQDELNIKHFSIHKLRHYIASKMHSLNIPSKYIEEWGGWANDNTLKKVYTHTINAEKEKYYKQINETIENIINTDTWKP